jgi:hypothetical protein
LHVSVLLEKPAREKSFQCRRPIRWRAGRDAREIHIREPHSGRGMIQESRWQFEFHAEPGRAESSSVDQQSHVRPAVRGNVIERDAQHRLHG